MVIAVHTTFMWGIRDARGGGGDLNGHSRPVLVFQGPTWSIWSQRYSRYPSHLSRGAAAVSEKKDIALSESSKRRTWTIRCAEPEALLKYLKSLIAETKLQVWGCRGGFAVAYR